MFKKIITLTICTYIAIFPLCIFNFSYAEDVETPPSGYTQILTDQQKVAAWKAYCASRNNKTIASFVQDAPFTLYEKYMYQKLQECATEADIDLDQVQADIYYNISNNDILSFWYSTSALNAYNRLFNIWLNKNNQNVDSPDYNTPNTENIYSGVRFETADGDSCLIYILDLPTKTQGAADKTVIMSSGTPLISSTELQAEKETGDSHILINVTSSKIWENNVQTQQMIGNTANTLLTFYTSNYNNISCLQLYPLNSNNEYNAIKSQVAIVYFNQSRVFAIGALSFNRNATFTVDTTKFYLNQLTTFTPSSYNSAEIDNVQGEYNNINNYDNSMIITTTNNSVNNFNNNYEGDVTTKNGGTKITINTGVVNNIPIDIQLPNMDDIIPDPISNIPNGFSIPGLRYKFPFCIPFDLIAVYEVLDTTPEAPHFETEINFASFNYDLVIDLEEYDPYMVHIRNYFLILYIFGLLFITPKLLKA